ncbi:hypothetical protein [Demequina lutea]|uniref:Uncharacterized protein n=1 Tax=Demequina lutea TaxID=431489 RepID=A0A7Y9ZD43_9MICO|nr:hypothetical protein [Demequina lutea]NYI41156.1 hypothetical protein [Demequina lutea]
MRIDATDVPTTTAELTAALDIHSRLPRWAGEVGGALATKAVRWGLTTTLPDDPTR